MQSQFTRWASTAILLSALAPAGVALAATEFIAASKMSEAHHRAVSQSGIVLIESVADARSDIRERDDRRAQREIRKALRLCHQIADASPSLRLMSILAETMNSLSTGGKTPGEQLAPIYQELDVYQQVAEVTAIRTQVDRAGSNLEAGEIEVAAADLERATTQIAFFEVDLPIQQTYALLHLASDDFERGDARMADTRLRKIQHSLKSFATIAAIEVDGAELADIDIDVAAPAE